MHHKHHTNMVPTMRDSTGTTCSHAPHTYAWYQPWETAQARLAHMHHTYAWYQQYENSFSLQSTVGLVFYATLKNCLDCIHTSNRAGSWWDLWKSAKHWWRPWEHGTGALELQYRRHNSRQKSAKLNAQLWQQLIISKLSKWQAGFKSLVDILIIFYSIRRRNFLFCFCCYPSTFPNSLSTFNSLKLCVHFWRFRMSS